MEKDGQRCAIDVQRAGRDRRAKADVPLVEHVFVFRDCFLKFVNLSISFA
jgi:hypothetical protein